MVIHWNFSHYHKSWSYFWKTNENMTIGKITAKWITYPMGREFNCDKEHIGSSILCPKCLTMQKFFLQPGMLAAFEDPQ